MGVGILALDLGLKTGWAFGVGESPPRASTIDFTALGDVASRGASFRQWLEDKIVGLDPADVIFETPLSYLPGTNARRWLAGLAHEVQVTVKFLQLEGRALRCLEQDPSSVKLHFTGNGNAKKPDMMAACRVRKWEFPDDNAADALALYDFSLAHLYPEDWRRLQIDRDLLAPLVRAHRQVEQLVAKPAPQRTFSFRKHKKRKRA